jgi:hypothetical protein
MRRVLQIWLASGGTRTLPEALGVVAPLLCPSIPHRTGLQCTGRRRARKHVPGRILLGQHGDRVQS